METTPKNIAIIVGIVIAALLGLFFAWKLTSGPAVITKFDIKLTDKDHVTGKKDSKVAIVEYSDFQCPACRAYQPMIKQVIDKNKDKIAFVYRYFPLPLHQNAVPSAYAAEAAGLQNKFWEMHDKLFDTQSDWENSKNPQDIFIKYATDMKLDVTKFKKDMNDPATASRINIDKDSGTQYAVDSTPTFFVNGIKLNSPQSVADFQKVIDAALNSK